jgi:hypothetical protein
MGGGGDMTADLRPLPEGLKWMARPGAEAGSLPLHRTPLGFALFTPVRGKECVCGHTAVLGLTCLTWWLLSAFGVTMCSLPGDKIAV